MVHHSPSEHAALDKMARVWEAQGYKVIREPNVEVRPKFLGSYTPDAIAIGPNTSLVIEVVNPSQRSVETRIRQLQRLLANEKGWKLEVVYLNSDQTTLSRASNEDIDNTLKVVEKLADIDHRAAFLLGWATLEAVTRATSPDIATKGLSPRSLIDLLVSQGHIKQSDGNKLRDLGNIRNQIVHGQLDLKPTSADIFSLVNFTKSILHR